MEKSLLIVKPGFIQHKEGIKKMLEEIGVTIVKELEMMLTDELINKHYSDYVNESWFGPLKEYMQSGKVIVWCAEGGEGSIPKIRELLGHKAHPAPGTIRYVYGIGDITKNVMHASDSVENGIKELKNFFPELV